MLSRFLISRMLTVTKVPMNKVRACVHRHLWPQQHTRLCLTTLPVTACKTNGRSVAQAIKISLEVKKYLVDNEHLDISQVPVSKPKAGLVPCQLKFAACLTWRSHRTTWRRSCLA